MVIERYQFVERTFGRLVIEIQVRGAIPSIGKPGRGLDLRSPTGTCTPRERSDSILPDADNDKVTERTFAGFVNDVDKVPQRTFGKLVIEPYQLVERTFGRLVLENWPTEPQGISR